MKLFVPVAAVVVAGLTNAAFADIIWDQQPNQNGLLWADSSGDNPDQRMADAFDVSADTSITGICFWGAYVFDNVAVADNFTINFYADDSGAVGDLVHTSTLANETRTDTGVDIFGRFDEYKYDADLTDKFSAATGNYWVSVTNDTGGGATGQSWAWESGLGPGSAAFSGDGGATWFGLGDESMAFQIKTPAPGALALLGIAGFAARRRRD
jgi:hypothetical protein